MDDRAGLFRPGWIAKLVVYGVGGENCKWGRGWKLMIFFARATRGLRRPSLNARIGRSISPHP